MKFVDSLKKRRSLLFVLVASFTFLIPMLAFGAAEDAAAGGEDWRISASKYFGAALAMSFSALGAAFAQAKIGAAAAGTLAENPDAGTMLIVLQALPEIIVLLGFVSALIISG